MEMQHGGSLLCMPVHSLGSQVLGPSTVVLEICITLKGICWLESISALVLISNEVRKVTDVGL